MKSRVNARNKCKDSVPYSIPSSKIQIIHDKTSLGDYTLRWNSIIGGTRSLVFSSRFADRRVANIKPARKSEVTGNLYLDYGKILEIFCKTKKVQLVENADEGKKEEEEQEKEEKETN